MRATISSLVATLTTNQQLLLEAAGATHHADLARVCYRLAEERGEFLVELENAARLPLSERRRGWPSSGSLERLRAALGRGDTASVLGALATSEQSLLDLYAAAIDDSDSDLVADCLLRQFKSIAAGHPQWSELAKQTGAKVDLPGSSARLHLETSAVNSDSLFGETRS